MANESRETRDQARNQVWFMKEDIERGGERQRGGDGERVRRASPGSWDKRDGGTGF